MKTCARKPRSPGRILIMILGIVLLLLLLLLLTFGFLMAGYSMRIKPQTLEEARTWQSEHYDISWYDGLQKDDYTVKSYDGYELHAERLYNPHPSDRFILISHGYTDNHIGSLKYTKMYLDLGFEVILYDLRGHGENEPTFCTYSARESHDLACLIEDSRKRYPIAKVFGIHGESLGAASSIACLKYKPDIDFIVSDCGFSEISSVLQIGLRGMHLPGFLTHIASLCAKLRYGYSYSEMRPIDSLKDNTVPILFLHGEKDTFILPMHSQNMQKATQGYSELHLIRDAGHAQSILFDPDTYRDCVQAFLERILTNDKPRS